LLTFVLIFKKWNHQPYQSHPCGDLARHALIAWQADSRCSDDTSIIIIPPENVTNSIIAHIPLLVLLHAKFLMLFAIVQQLQ
jgi:hypothetical protein